MRLTNTRLYYSDTSIDWINQSNFYSPNIPSEVKLSDAIAESVFNGKIDETVPWHQRAIVCAGVEGGKAKSKRCLFTCFLKAATEMAEQTHSDRLFQRDGMQEWKALGPVLVLTLGTDKLILLLDLSERDGSDGARHGVKINRLLFMKHFVGQQSDLVLNNILNFTGNQWRERSSGTLWVKGGDFVTTWASWFWTHLKFGEVSVCDTKQ